MSGSSYPFWRVSRTLSPNPSSMAFFSKGSFVFVTAARAWIVGKFSNTYLRAAIAKSGPMSGNASEIPAL